MTGKINSRAEIKTEDKKLAKESQDASKKNLEVANVAEKTKQTLESLHGEGTSEAARAMEQASQELQQSIDTRQTETLRESQNIDQQIEKQKQAFEKSSRADHSDITKLQDLGREAEKAGVSTKDIEKANQAKLEEIQFLGTESQFVEAKKQEMHTKVNESKQRRQEARMKYQSKSTLD